MLTVFELITTHHYRLQLCIHSNFEIYTEVFQVAPTCRRDGHHELLILLLQYWCADRVVHTSEPPASSVPTAQAWRTT